MPPAASTANTNSRWSTPSRSTKWTSTAGRSRKSRPSATVPLVLLTLRVRNPPPRSPLPRRPPTPGRNLPALSAGDRFPQSSYVRWTATFYNDAGDMTASRVYRAIPAFGAGVPGVNYDETTYGQDIMNRQNMTARPAGRSRGSCSTRGTMPWRLTSAPTTPARPTNSPTASKPPAETSQTVIIPASLARLPESGRLFHSATGPIGDCLEWRLEWRWTLGNHSFSRRPPSPAPRGLSPSASQIATNLPNSPQSAPIGDVWNGLDSAQDGNTRGLS